VMRMPVQFAPTPNKVVVRYKNLNLFNTLLTTNQASSRMLGKPEVIQKRACGRTTAISSMPTSGQRLPFTVGL